jgi:FMN reductase [NAD(P)H]
LNQFAELTKGIPMIDRYIGRLRERFADDGPDGNGVEDIPFIQQTLSRKTVRRYSKRIPSAQLLDLLVATALSASAKSDFQQASILRVVDAQKRAAIGSLFQTMPWIDNAPAFYIFLGDALRLERIGEMRGKTIANGSLEGFFNASIDAALVMQTFILAAESAGLGCCPISVIRDRIAEIAQFCELPDKVFPVAGLCVGYPSDEGHVSLRLPRSVTVHLDRYDEGNLERQIDGYDRARDARHPILRDQQRAPGTFGHAALYGWSEDKSRQAASPESKAFSSYLRAHGFTLD